MMRLTMANFYDYNTEVLLSSRELSEYLNISLEATVDWLKSQGIQVMRTVDTGKNLFGCPIKFSPDINENCLILLSEDGTIIGKILNIGNA